MSPTNVQKVIVACPVSGCELRHVAGRGVLMVIRYIEKGEQLETGERTILQALIDPEQALAISEALKRSVQALQFGKSLKKSLKKPAKEPPMMLEASNPDSSQMADAVEMAEAVNA